MAPRWRKAVRILVVILGFGTYAAAQLALGLSINVSHWILILLVYFAILICALAVRWTLPVFLVWLVVSPFARELFTFKQQGLPLINLDGVLILVLTIILVFRLLTDRVKPKALSFSEWLLIAFVAWVFLGKVIRGEMTKNVIQLFYFQIGIWPVLYFVTKALARKREHVIKIALAIVVAGTCAGIAMLYEAYAGQSYKSLVFGTYIPLPTRDIGVGGRARGPFGDPDEPAVFLATTLFLIFHLAYYSRNKLYKALYFGAGCIVVLGIAYTYTRNIYITCALFTLLMPIFAREKRAYFLGILAACLIGLAILLPIRMSDRLFYERMSDPSNAYHRLIFMRTSMNMIRHNFWFGVGFLNSERETPKYVVSREQYEGLTTGWRRGLGAARPTYVHNSYLYLTQENGIIGAVLFFGAVFGIFWRLFRMSRSIEKSGILGSDFAAILVVSMMTWSVSLMSYANIGRYYGNYIFLITLALGIRLYEMMIEAPRETTDSELDSRNGSGNVSLRATNEAWSVSE